MYDLGSLGNMDLEVTGSFQEPGADGKVQDKPFSFKAKRMSTLDALEVLRECPVSMGIAPSEVLVSLQAEEVSAQRRKEHEFMVAKAKTCVPPEYHHILDHIPYLNFLWLIDYLIRGDERVAGGKAVSEVAKAMEKQFRIINPDGTVKKKQVA